MKTEPFITTHLEGIDHDELISLVYNLNNLLLCSPPNVNGFCKVVQKKAIVCQLVFMFEERFPVCVSVCHCKAPEMSGVRY